MTLRIAIASDLHCHEGSSATQQSFLLSDALRAPANNHPVEALTRSLLDPYGIRADILLAPGDLTNQIGQQGLISGWDFIREIGGALEVSTIVSTLGNHDVNSRPGGMDPFRLPKGIGKGYPVADAQALASFWAHGFCIVETPAVRIVVINSVADHFDEVRAKRGSVTNELIEQLDSHLRGLAFQRTIALVHHHPIQHDLTGMVSDDLMLNGQPLLECLATHGVRLVIHGHKHFPRLRYFDAAGAIVTVFAAGSFSATNANLLNTTNLFHVLELPEETLTGCTMLGRIRSWEYTYGRGWRPAHLRSADIPSVAGFGCTCEPAGLADDIAAFVHAVEEDVIAWSIIEAQFPRLPFVPPTQFLVIAERLKDTYGLQVMPDNGEPPSRLVRISGATS